MTSVKVKETKNGLLLTKQSGSYSSEVKHHGDNTYYSYDVTFDQPTVCLEETNRYAIVSLICGGVSWYGNGGKNLLSVGEWCSH